MLACASVMEERDQFADGYLYTICICIYIYIYTYIHLPLSLSIYIYIYIYNDVLEARDQFADGLLVALRRDRGEGLERQAPDLFILFISVVQTSNLLLVCVLFMLV